MEDSHLTKKYYKIKDASEIIGVPQSTLRYWESEFPDINPRRSSHNQRYYSPEDIKTLQMIKFLIKDKGLKIEAAKDYLKTNRKNISKQLEVKESLLEIREELKGLLQALNIRGRHLGVPYEES